VVFRLDNPISEETFLRLRETLKSRLNIDYEKLGSNDRYWVVYFFMQRFGGNFMHDVRQALQKANFSRNQAIACAMAAAICFSSIKPLRYDYSPCALNPEAAQTCDSRHNQNIATTSDSHPILLTDRDIWRTGWVLILFSFVFLCRFFVSHYLSTKLLFRATAAVPTHRMTRKRSIGTTVGREKDPK
jgi:hypothetical protein